MRVGIGKKGRKVPVEVNPEARKFGPGRVVMVEPHIDHEHGKGVIWVYMGREVWRCECRGCADGLRGRDQHGQFEGG